MVNNLNHPVTTMIHLILHRMHNNDLTDAATDMKKSIDMPILKEIIAKYNKELNTTSFLTKKQLHTCFYYFNKFLGNQVDEFISILSTLCS